MVIGKNVLTYKELVTAMTKCHKTIKVIRGAATGTPGRTFPTPSFEPIQGTRVVGAGQMQMRPSDYLRELSRLMVTHS